MSEMHWEDPPPSERRTVNRWTAEFANQCRQHPGKWARVIDPYGRDEIGLSTIASLKGRGLQVRMTSKREDGSKTPNSVFRVWVRWPETLDQESTDG